MSSGASNKHHGSTLDSLFEELDELNVRAAAKRIINDVVSDPEPLTRFVERLLVEGFFLTSLSAGEKKKKQRSDEKN